MKKERATISDEQRERQLIAEQIERAAADAADEPQEVAPEQKEFKREEGAEKVVLSLSISKPAAPAKAATTGLKLNPLKVNPLKRPNVFKSAGSSSKKSPDGSNDKKRGAPVSAAEALIVEEQERKRRRMDKDNAA